MNRFLCILTFIVLNGCSNKPDIKGYWRLSFDEKIENNFLPFELSFDKDTLLIVDTYNFKQSAVYNIFGDSISITFTNGLKKKYFLSVLSDSTIKFADMVYSRIFQDDFSSIQSYELLGWLSDHEFCPKTNSITIHLIKDGDSTMVILNDVTTGLKDLPYFLSWGHGEQPKISLYLGQGIKLIDLLEAYCWIKYTGYRKIELVTSNASFENFYSVHDFVDVDDSTFMQFLYENSLPPPPPQPKLDNEVIDQFIYSESDSIIHQQSDTATYRYNFSSELDIKSYLEMTENLNNSEKRKLKRLMIPNNRK